MYMRLSYVLILIFSQLVFFTTTFQLGTSFFKKCGSAMNVLKSVRDYFRSINCKLIEKKDNLKVQLKKLFGSSVEKLNEQITPIKPYLSYENIYNLILEPEEIDTRRKFMTPNNTGGEISRNCTKKTEETSTSKDFESVNLYGFDAEVHTVITQDGYVLTLHRIPVQINSHDHNRQHKNRTVILHHGLLGSSTDWILLGRNNSLPYLLNEAGYDVWLANARGNIYSKEHVTKNIHSSEYWDFSWHEIGLYDLSSTIDYIYEKTFTKSQMFFVAHSMSATALMVLLSTSPQYNKMFDLVVLLAPLVYMQQAKGPIRLISEMQHSNYSATVKILGGDYFNPSESFINILVRKFCRGEIRLCRHPVFMISNGGKPINNALHKVNLYTRVQPEGSVKTLMHYGQLINSGKFEMFDEGSAVNIKKFGFASPPKYHLRDVKLPVVLFSSHDDWLSTVPDIHSLLSKLPNPVAHHVVETTEEFSHYDFVWSENASELVYKYIFDFFDQNK